MNNIEKFETDFPEFKEYSSTLNTLVGLLLEKNQHVNLTAIRNEDDVWSKHMYDSLMIGQLLAEQPLIKDVVDVGTGGGFPGLPIAVCFKDRNVVLVDSTRKKVDAVNEFIGALGLKNARAQWARAEDLATHYDYRNKFDLVTARAVGFLPELMNQCFGLVKKGGFLAFYKIINDEELVEGNKMAQNLNLKHFKNIQYKLAQEDQLRTILIYQKS